MKKLKIILTVLITGLLTMSMGFPTDLASNRTVDKSDTKPCPSIVESAVVVMTNANPVRKAGLTETSLIQSFSMPSLHSKIIIKVFDAKGKLIRKQQVDREDFLRKPEKLSLPAGSTFVMFHQNTAYYFLETSVMN